jgi:pyruvate/2-oxoglutarate dehydrogenase complex dihydrolipoamide dehydrogenase (E3) component
MHTQPWSSTVDWICIGSGAGGCAAAIAGQAQGFTTMLVESGHDRAVGGHLVGPHELPVAGSRS